MKGWRRDVKRESAWVREKDGGWKRKRARKKSPKTRERERELAEWRETESDRDGWRDERKHPSVFRRWRCRLPASLF